MAISAARKSRLESRIAQREKYLDILYGIQDNWDGVESYSFDSGEGKQQTKFRSISELDQAIRRTESQIDRLYRVLLGKSVINVNLRRT